MQNDKDDLIQPSLILFEVHGLLMERTKLKRS